jgi:hypothetical protein
MHKIVYQRLQQATRGLSGEKYATAFKRELQAIGEEVATPGTELNVRAP